MQISDHCFAVTGLGYVSPWCVNSGFIVGNKMTLVVDTGGNTALDEKVEKCAFYAAF
jgi:hypothetical protein